MTPVAFLGEPEWPIAKRAFDDDQGDTGHGHLFNEIGKQRPATGPTDRVKQDRDNG